MINRANRTPGNAVAADLSSLACVTVDVPLTGIDLLILSSHIKSSTEATIASMKAAHTLGEGEVPIRARMPSEVSAVLTVLADAADEQLAWLHTAYERAVDALYEARRAALAAGNLEYRGIQKPDRAPAPKVDR